MLWRVVETCLRCLCVVGGRARLVCRTGSLNDGSADSLLVLVQPGTPHVIAGHCKQAPGPHKLAWAETVEACNQLCRRARGNYTYFGVQMGGDGCFCGDSYGSQGRAPGSACNVPCRGNQAEMCGGPNLNSVYAVTA